jgi:hypothetical protein
VNCNILILRNFLSGDRRGFGPSDDGGVYVNASSFNFRQPFAAELASEVSDGIMREHAVFLGCINLLCCGSGMCRRGFCMV